MKIRVTRSTICFGIGDLESAKLTGDKLMAITTNQDIVAVAQEPKEQPSPLRLLVIEDSAEDFNLCIETLRSAQLNICAAHVASGACAASIAGGP